MVDHEEIQAFIERLGEGVEDFEEIEPGLWVLRLSEDLGQIVVNHAPPVVVLRVNVMKLPVPGPQRSELMQKLLELNAGDLVHGAYGIEGEQIVLSDALQLESLDFHEFQASIESITLALGSHMTAIAQSQE